MKKFLILLSVVTLIVGCGRPLKATLAKINNYEINKEEFEEEFKQSAFGRIDTLESREEFLNNLINRKLIMQDGQRQGLDKNKNFLKLIEKFWEQSLLKLTLDKKTQQVAGSVFVSDKEIEQVYNKMLKDDKTDKTYAQMYGQIKWELTRFKQSKMMDAWVGKLRKDADIKINHDLLKKDK